MSVLMEKEEIEDFKKNLLVLGPLVERDIYLSEQHIKEFIIFGRCLFDCGNFKSITSNTGNHGLQKQ